MSEPTTTTSNTTTEVKPEVKEASTATEEAAVTETSTQATVEEVVVPVVVVEPQPTIIDNEIIGEIVTEGEEVVPSIVVNEEPAAGEPIPSIEETKEGEVVAGEGEGEEEVFVDEGFSDPFEWELYPSPEGFTHEETDMLKYLVADDFLVNAYAGNVQGITNSELKDMMKTKLEELT